MHLHTLSVLAASALLAACSSLNPVTLARLAQLDPMTADPGAIAIRLDLPDGLVVPPGGATLDIASARSDTGQSVKARLALTERAGIWALDPADAARLRSLRAQIRQWEAEAPEANSGSFSLGITGCATGDGPDPAAPVRADLSLDGGASFLPFLRGASVAQVLEMTGPDRGAVPLCTG
ncbi:MAG: hypothetical protein R3D85_00695 [Paracoccaceae bacterium]